MKVTKVFVERREDDLNYAIRKPGSQRASGIGSTQLRAAEEAREMFPDAIIMLERCETQRTEAGISGGNLTAKVERLGKTLLQDHLVVCLGKANGRKLAYLLADGLAQSGRVVRKNLDVM